MTESDRRCETCKWWEPPQVDGLEGTCHVAHPQVYSSECDDGSLFCSGVFPETSYYCWCGEHAPTDKEKK